MARQRILAPFPPLLLVCPPLQPYEYDALEPSIDEATMRVHHLGHHQGYTNKINAVRASLALLQRAAAGPNNPATARLGTHPALRTRTRSSRLCKSWQRWTRIWPARAWMLC